MSAIGTKRTSLVALHVRFQGDMRPADKALLYAACAYARHRRAAVPIPPQCYTPSGASGQG